MEEFARFLGSVSEIEKDQLDREADVLLMPSRIEGFGIVFLEAAMYRICSVCVMPLLPLDVISPFGSEWGDAARVRCEQNLLWDRFGTEWRSVFDVSE